MEQQELLAAPTGMSPGPHRPKQSSISFPSLTSSAFILQCLLFSIALTQWQMHFHPKCQGKEDWFIWYRSLYHISWHYGWGRILPSIWWISSRAQSYESCWISCQSHGRAGLRNKPLSPALCHVFTTLLFAKISQQNQSVCRLLSKTILYFLHPLYSYLSIYFLIFLFMPALNSTFFYISILGANDQICCQK